MRRLAVCFLASALLVSAAAKAAPPSVPVSVINTHSNPVPVTIDNMPTVNVAHIPAGGTLYQEVLGVTINVAGAVPGLPGSAVPAGKRRIITMISARTACPTGHAALLYVSAPLLIALPTQFVYNDNMGRANHAMTITMNFIMPPGSQLTPISEGDGSSCLGDVFLSGVEVPDQP
jgi:hypothetical protein